jgi:hypothetical protein
MKSLNIVVDDQVILKEFIYDAEVEQLKSLIQSLLQSQIVRLVL